MNTYKHEAQASELSSKCFTQMSFVCAANSERRSPTRSPSCRTLSRATHDGRIEFDSNLAENAARPAEFGKKNWMFVGGKDSDWRRAVIYTFIEQVRALGSAPFAYLECVFEKLPGMTNQDDFEPLLPVNWIAAQQSKQQSAVA